MVSEIESQSLKFIRKSEMVKKPFKILEYKEIKNKFDKSKTFIYAIDLVDEKSPHRVLIYSRFLEPNKNYRIILGISDKNRPCFVHEEIFKVDNKWKVTKRVT